jgi:hypothetical protein
MVLAGIGDVAMCQSQEQLEVDVSLRQAGTCPNGDSRTQALRFEVSVTITNPGDRPARIPKDLTIYRTQVAGDASFSPRALIAYQESELQPLLPGLIQTEETPSDAFYEVPPQGALTMRMISSLSIDNTKLFKPRIFFVKFFLGTTLPRDGKSGLYEAESKVLQTPEIKPLPQCGSLGRPVSTPSSHR